MNLNTLSAYLVTIFGRPAGEFAELQRALKEGSAHFDELNEKSDIRPEIERDHARLASQIVGKAGPGGGIEADPFHAAFFIVAFMLNGPRSKSAEATWSAWHLPTEGSVTSGFGPDFQPTFVVCGLTGAILFGEAFKHILADGRLSKRVKQIEVGTSDAWARIVFDDDKATMFRDPYAHSMGYFDRTAVLTGSAVEMIATLITR